MYGYIYLTTNNLNGMKYIGLHKTSKNGLDESYLGSGLMLTRAIKKYGRENFSCEILEVCDSRESLSNAEIKWIKFYNADTSKQFYNISRGGEGHSCDPWNKGKHGVQERTDKMESALEYGRHLPASDKLKEILSNYRKTVVVADSTKEKLRKNQLGRKAINNGEINKYVFEEDLDHYLSNGWVLGIIRKKKLS